MTDGTGETPAPLGFEDRVAIVTGAGSGLGRSHALELARHFAECDSRRWHQPIQGKQRAWLDRGRLER